MDDDLKFNNWKHSIEEILTDVAMRQQESEKRMQEAEKRMQASEKRMDRFERNLVRLARLGQRARSDLKRRQEEHERWQQEHERLQAIINQNLAEITDKLNGLIGHVQNQNPPQL
jgi:DNA repair exonuclease SbcCD ATPase subunit